MLLPFTRVQNSLPFHYSKIPVPSQMLIKSITKIKGPQNEEPLNSLSSFVLHEPCVELGNETVLYYDRNFSTLRPSLQLTRIGIFILS